MNLVVRNNWTGNQSQVSLTANVLGSGDVVTSDATPRNDGYVMLLSATARMTPRSFYVCMLERAIAEGHSVCLPVTLVIHA